MPVKRAAYKALRQNVTAHARNLIVRNGLKKLAVEFRKAVTAKDKSKVADVLTRYVKALDKAAQKNVIHRNAAARKKARLAAAAKKVA